MTPGQKRDPGEANPKARSAGDTESAADLAELEAGDVAGAVVARLNGLEPWLYVRAALKWN